MANKQTGLIYRPYIATFLLLLVVLLLACTKGKEGPSVSVPADCQQFLDKYFDAWKSKDIATLQDLTFVHWHMRDERERKQTYCCCDFG